MNDENFRKSLLYFKKEEIDNFLTKYNVNTFLNELGCVCLYNILVCNC